MNPKLSLKLCNLGGVRLLLLLLCLLPLQALAEEYLVASNYRVYVSGSNTITADIACYNGNEGLDSWIKEGTLTAEWTDDDGGSHSATVVKWTRSGVCDDVSTGVFIGFSTTAGGEVKVNDTYTVHTWEQSFELYPFASEKVGASVKWILPYDVMGHNGNVRDITFSWDITWDYNGPLPTEEIAVSPTTLQAPSAANELTPMVTMATLSLEEKNKLDVNWFVASNNLTAASYEYLDKDSTLVTDTLPTSQGHGIINIDANVPHKRFRVYVSYKDNNEYLIENVKSESQDMAMIHCPVELTATTEGGLKSKVRLDWKILHADVPDITSTDFFEVERSLTGQEADFVTIGSVPFVLDSTSTTFSFTDSTLVSSATEAWLTDGSALPNLTYRVRRSITREWGWDDNVGAQSVTHPLSGLHLQRIASYNVEWKDERAFQAVVTWQYDNDAGAVWDSRAQVKLRITKTNIAGEQVSVQDMVLTDADREACRKDIDLSQTCVYYQIELYVDPLTSPFTALATGAYTPPDDQFYHEANGHVSQELLTQARQSSVVLSWTVEDGVVDYYQVLRRPAGGGEDDWETVADMVSSQGYEDTDVMPLADYEYKVRAIIDCEGLHYSETDVVAGACKHTGRVAGYVRLQDGTGVAGIGVRVAAGTTDVTATTDEKGYYMADGLPYQGQTSITYTVTPISPAEHPLQLEVDTYPVTFNEHSNDELLHEFTVTNSYRFSGYVMYSGTSIPVKGAHFRVNGHEVHDIAGKPVETGFDGSFTFRVLNGLNKIQTVMDGHDFSDDGYFNSPDGYVFSDNVDQIYFYDDTKVKLTGRIVGGDDQGRLPLDHNLSRNNLGDGLTMVLTLEGDNKSWLLYDNLNPGLSTRTDSISHPGGGDHKTRFTVQRKRMEVKPDSLTGEFVLMLPPVRWKMQQIYCEGYPTLFQDGQVSEVIDLTECLTPQSVAHSGTYTSVDGTEVQDPVETYNYCYRRVYHTPVEITYRQTGYDNFDYFGDKNYLATTLGGDKVEVPLAYVKNDTVGYTFGYPVFSVERRYGIEISVVERYIYNNDVHRNKMDLVQIGGGVVTVQNGMQNGLRRDTVALDDQGRGRFLLAVEQTPRLLTGEDALRTVTMTLKQDGITYEAKPLRGYILNMFSLSTTKDVIATEQPLLFDILRDPPGGGSSATLSKGSTLKCSYTVDMKFEAGFKFNFGIGTNIDRYSGYVTPSTEFGLIDSATNYDVIDMDVIFSGAGSKAYSYTMTVGQDISTSSSSTMVGADADLYIGVVQNMVVNPMSTIRAIPDDMYQKMLGRDADNLAGSSDMTPKQDSYGSLIHIAEGTDANNNTYHLVRDVSLGYGPKVTSQFVYSQRHIIGELLPELAREIYALLFTGTRQEAQTQADQTGKTVYLSLVPPSDERFGCLDQYEPIYPNSTPQGTDEVREKYSIIKAWIDMVALNEKEKLTAYDLVANYAVDGGSDVTYSETFETDLSKSEYMCFPFSAADYFGDNGSNAQDKGWTAGAILASEGGIASLLKLLFGLIPGEAGAHYNDKENNKTGLTELDFTGYKFSFSMTPVAEYSSTGTYGTGTSYNRKESFTLSMAGKSHLDVDVLRVNCQPLNGQTASGTLDVYTNANFEESLNNMTSHLVEGVDLSKAIYPHSFVYRTRGGATCNPWEDQRVTQAYNMGTVLDERTKKIVNPKIKMDRQSISGVAVGDAARFKVYLSNESEQPEALGPALNMLNFYLDEASNPKGAKVYVDGTPLNSNGIDVYVEPGQQVQKTIEVYAGDEFDYDSLMLVLTHNDDWVHVYDEVHFDVHFLHTAGPVNISVPGERWVMNTDSEYDDKRGWFIPVTIDGFNKHQHNFDHIEFQYKESRRGDNNWTNLCSFYADSLLMAAATGQRAIIPENGNIHYDFYGEGPVMEMAYDLRAVLYCRNGNSFLTTPSKIISGVKDTRRPQLFGHPEPYNGVLTAGKNIVFNFSEDIEYNYLSSITNFEVKGEVNNSNVSEMVSIRFDGEASLEGDAERNFSSKDVTIDLMVNPDSTGRDMPLFSHGTNGKKLQLWLADDFKLRAVVDEQTFTSIKPIVTGMFTQVALVIDHETDSLHLYNGGDALGDFKLESEYNGTGPLIFGRTNEANRSQSSFYQGRMMEARLWYKALNRATLSSTYGSRRLSGYELGLVDYYPMNEGSGDYAIDKAQGANATLRGAAWARPRGLSLHTDGTGIDLKQEAITRTSEQDYTLMFWFKTTGNDGTLVSNGPGRKTDAGAQNQFFIGLLQDTLTYRSNGHAFDLGRGYNDGQWHHYAMTVNRTKGVGNIYVDQTLTATFEPDSIGGISGGYPCLGATRYDSNGARIDTLQLDAHIDELMLFAQALPPTLVNTYAKKSPNGDESGMLTYLAFDRQERQKNNNIELVAYAYSRKLYLDADGNVRYELDPTTQQNTDTPMRDYLFQADIDDILERIDATTAAPVVPYEELKNLKFDFVGKDNQLLISLNELSSRINHRNVYVTVRDVEDLNGNAMASPETACFYVSNSSLKWLKNHRNCPVAYGGGESILLELSNGTESNHTYTIENCPRWLTLSSYTDVINAQSTETIRATVNPALNVGSYDEIIYLVDEDGVAEPLYLTVVVQGEQPDWAESLSGSLLEYSMSITGKVYMNGEIDVNPNDIVGVFDKENRCHGYANINYSPLTGESNLFLTVYDNRVEGTPLYFKLWQYSTGLQYMLTINGKKSLTFKESLVLGTDSLVRFEGGNTFVQTFDLKEGWNWISFNVYSDEMLNLNNLLQGMPWKYKDALTDLNGNTTLLYDGTSWVASSKNSALALSNATAYAIRVSTPMRFPIAGSIIKRESMRTITVKHGWNGIGYTPMINLPVETALSDYYDKAEPGDIIKSRDEFAYFTMNAGVGRWRGNLQYLKPGEGYMMQRKGEGDVTFRYPFYEPGSTFIDLWSTTGAVIYRQPAVHAGTMSLSAIVVDIETSDGDLLVAYADGEVVGRATVSKHDEADEAEPLYMSISTEEKRHIWFSLERDGQVVAHTPEVMTFKTNDVIGTPDEPTAIHFTQSDGQTGLWYTAGGLLLPGKPSAKGVYIYNGKKVIIK